MFNDWWDFWKATSPAYPISSSSHFYPNFLESLLSARHCVKYFPWRASLNSHKTWLGQYCVPVVQKRNVQMEELAWEPRWTLNHLFLPPMPVPCRSLCQVGPEDLAPSSWGSPLGPLQLQALHIGRNGNTSGPQPWQDWYLCQWPRGLLLVQGIYTLGDMEKT